MHKLSLQGLYVKILIEWVRDKERGAKREREDRKRVGRVGERRWRGGGGGGGLSFFRLQGRCFSKSAWGYTPAPRLP